MPFFENRGGSAKALDIIVDDEALQTTSSSGPLIPGNRYRNLGDESQLSLLDNLPAFGSWTINISTDNNQEVLFIRSLALGLTSNTDDHGATPHQASQLVETKGEGLIFSESGRIENRHSGPDGGRPESERDKEKACADDRAQLAGGWPSRSCA